MRSNCQSLSLPPGPPLVWSNWYCTGVLGSEAAVAVMEMVVVPVSPGRVENNMGSGVGAVVSGADLNPEFDALTEPLNSTLVPRTQ